MHPGEYYRKVKELSDNGVENSKVLWNFLKYMIDEEGQIVGHFTSTVKQTQKSGQLD